MKLKCLIIEDALFLREVYRYSLKNENVEIVAEASDGVEALIKINEYKPDLIILDLVLPLKNGFDVLKEISHLSPHSKCIVISSLDDQATISKALALGAIQYLTKPFTKTELIKAIAEVGQMYKEVFNG